MNVMNAQQSSLYRSTRLYFCVSLIVYMLLRIALASITPTNTPMVSIVLAITVVPAPRTPCRPLLWLFGSGKNVWVSQTSDRLGSPILWFPLYVVCWCWISCTCPWSPTAFLRLCMVSCVGLFLCFCYYFIISAAESLVFVVHDCYAGITHCAITIMLSHIHSVLKPTSVGNSFL